MLCGCCQVLLTYTGRYWDLGWVPCLALCTAIGTLLLLCYCLKESASINAGISFNTWMGVLNPLVRRAHAPPTQTARGVQCPLLACYSLVRCA